MKALLIAATLTAATAFGATAATLPNDVAATVQQLVPEADLTAISTEQAGAIWQIFANEDNFDGTSPAGTIRAILGLQG